MSARSWSDVVLFVVCWTNFAVSTGLLYTTQLYIYIYTYTYIYRYMGLYGNMAARVKC